MLAHFKHFRSLALDFWPVDRGRPRAVDGASVLRLTGSRALDHKLP